MDPNSKQYIIQSVRDCTMTSGLEQKPCHVVSDREVLRTAAVRSTVLPGRHRRGRRCGPRDDGLALDATYPCGWLPVTPGGLRFAAASLMLFTRSARDDTRDSVPVNGAAYAADSRGSLSCGR